MSAEQHDTEAIFWRAFLRQVGPMIGVAVEQVDQMTDDLVTSAGREVVDGFAPAFEAVGRLVAKGVAAYRQERDRG